MDMMVAVGGTAIRGVIAAGPLCFLEPSKPVCHGLRVDSAVGRTCQVCHPLSSHDAPVRVVSREIRYVRDAGIIVRFRLLKKIVLLKEWQHEHGPIWTKGIFHAAGQWIVARRRIRHSYTNR